MNNIIQKMNNIVQKTYSWTKLAFLVILVFAFLAGAAMALEPAVVHQGLGIAAWTLTMIVIGLCIIEKVVAEYVITWAQIREGEAGEIARWVINVSAGTFLFIMTVVALALH